MEGDRPLGDPRSDRAAPSGEDNKLRRKQKRIKRNAALARGKPRRETQVAEVTGRVPLDGRGEALHYGDVTNQIHLCLEDIRTQLEAMQMPLSAIYEMTVRTTDFDQARSQAPELARWQRQVGAFERVIFQAVDTLGRQGAAVEIIVDAAYHEPMPTQLFSAEPGAEPIPEHLRAALRAEIDALVCGDRPEHLARAEEYSVYGGRLVVQPEEIWDHPQSFADRYVDGGWRVRLPLWTSTECPSDLSAELLIDATGGVSIENVRVM